MVRRREQERVHPTNTRQDRGDPSTVALDPFVELQGLGGGGNALVASMMQPDPNALPDGAPGGLLQVAGASAGAGGQGGQVAQTGASPVPRGCKPTSPPKKRSKRRRTPGRRKKAPTLHDHGREVTAGERKTLRARGDAGDRPRTCGGRCRRSWRT